MGGHAKKIVAAIVIGAIILGLAAASGAFFVVNLTQYAIVFEFGEVQRVIKEPGLYFKIPFIQKATLLEKRILEWDEPPTEILTVDKENIAVNTWARWKITDPMQFYLSLRSITMANTALTEAIESSVKSVLSSYTLMEVLRSSNRDLKYTTKDYEDIRKEIPDITKGRPELMKIVLDKARTKVKDKYGIEIVDVGIKYINYIQDVIPKIFDRMKSERYRIASKYESEGREKEAEIKGQIKKQLQTLESEGYREAETIKGSAEAEVIKIYADAYNKSPEFYNFYKKLQTYIKTFSDKTTLILSSDSELFKLLKSYSTKK